MTDPRSNAATDPPTGPELRVFPTLAALYDAVAGEIVRVLSAAIAERGVAHWSTTGGSAAPPIYERLRVPPLRDALDWGSVQVWWGDDRFVPADHPLSNVQPLEQILLASGGDEVVSGPPMAAVGSQGDGVRIPAGNLHPIRVAEAIARGGAAWAAARYAVELRDAGPPGDAAGTPAFDLLLLGVGPDGHILSVFPGSAAWDDPATCVAIPAPTHVEPHVERVTVTPRAVAAAHRVLVVTAGASKADVLARAWSTDDVRSLPLASTRLGSAVWMLDEAAAGSLPRA
jgi:6-phosphogluconolactonase